MASVSPSRPEQFVRFFDSLKRVIDGLNAVGVLVLLLGVFIGQQAFIHQFLGLKVEQSADLSSPVLLRTNVTLSDFLESAKLVSMETAQMDGTYGDVETAARGRVYSVLVRIKGYPKERYDTYYTWRDGADRLIDRNRLFQLTTETTDDSFDLYQFWVPANVRSGTIVLRREICVRASWFSAPDCRGRAPIAVRTLETTK